MYVGSLVEAPVFFKICAKLYHPCDGRKMSQNAVLATLVILKPNIHYRNYKFFTNTLFYYNTDCIYLHLHNASLFPTLLSGDCFDSTLAWRQGFSAQLVRESPEIR